jgi:hypothetical protein
MNNCGFVADHDCAGRTWRPRWKRVLADLLCRFLGHNLWRIMGSQRTLPYGSLPLFATICCRCLKGGYVEGDYYR